MGFLVTHFHFHNCHRLATHFTLTTLAFTRSNHHIKRVRKKLQCANISIYFDRKTNCLNARQFSARNAHQSSDLKRSGITCMRDVSACVKCTCKSRKIGQYTTHIHLIGLIHATGIYFSYTFKALRENCRLKPKCQTDLSSLLSEQTSDQKR